MVHIVFRTDDSCEKSWWEYVYYSNGTGVRVSHGYRAGDPVNWKKRPFVWKMDGGRHTFQNWVGDAVDYEPDSVV